MICLEIVHVSCVVCGLKVFLRKQTSIWQLEIYDEY